jgi:hypothetical protein
MWILEHILAFEGFLEDSRDVHSNSAFIPNGELTERIRGIVTYLVNGGSLDSTAVALAIRNSQGRGGGELGDVIVDLIQKTKQTDSFVGSRALKRLLVQYFESGDVNKDDAEVWLDIARGVEKAGTHSFTLTMVLTPDTWSLKLLLCVQRYFGVSLNIYLLHLRNWTDTARSSPQLFSVLNLRTRTLLV